MMKAESIKYLIYLAIHYGVLGSIAINALQLFYQKMKSISHALNLVWPCNLLWLIEAAEMMCQESLGLRRACSFHLCPLGALPWECHVKKPPLVWGATGKENWGTPLTASANWQICEWGHFGPSRLKWCCMSEPKRNCWSMHIESREVINHCFHPLCLGGKGRIAT